MHMWYRLKAHTIVEIARLESFRETVVSPASSLLWGWNWLIAFIPSRFLDERIF